MNVYLIGNWFLFRWHERGPTVIGLRTVFLVTATCGINGKSRQTAQNHCPHAAQAPFGPTADNRNRFFHRFVFPSKDFHGAVR
jgi:hypothetical protein